MLKKLVTVTRSGSIESEHYGIGAIVNSDGKILKEWGDSSQLIYPRSSLKPIQSLNLFKDGHIEKENLSEKQIAFSTSSHFAERTRLPNSIVARRFNFYDISAVSR